MINRTAYAALLFFLLASACAHSPAPTPCVTPAAGLRYCLLPPAAITADAAPRLVHIIGRDIDQHMISQLAVSGNRLTLVATSLLGHPLFEIRYMQDAGGHSTIDVAPETAAIKAEWLIALLQLAQADVAMLNAALTDARLETDGAWRFLVRGDDTLVMIESRPAFTEITVPGQALRIRIQKLDDRNTPQ